MNWPQDFPIIQTERMFADHEKYVGGPSSTLTFYMLTIQKGEEKSLCQHLRPDFVHTEEEEKV